MCGRDLERINLVTTNKEKRLSIISAVQEAAKKHASLLDIYAVKALTEKSYVKDANDCLLKHRERQQMVEEVLVILWKYLPDEGAKE